ncbi:MAG: hypothetical protein ACRC1K_12945 [Planctomycetia bacterium]
MFRPEEIQARLREKPFRPLRFIVSEGRRYDVHHPDLVLVGERDLVIGFARPSRPTIFDRTVRVAIMHLVAIEEIDPSTTPAVTPN